MPKDYDALIIGSGLGGLTCGAFLARAGMRVLVAEKHTKIGGYAHSFKRGEFRFESAIHSVAMSSTGLIVHLLEQLGIRNRIQTAPHSSMFSFVSPDDSFTMPASRDEIVASLCCAFPQEQKSLTALFDHMHSLYETMVKPTWSPGANPYEDNREFISQFRNRSYSDIIAGHLGDPRLRRIFFAQWPFVCASPDYAPAVYNVLMFYVHAVEGSHYIVGGFEVLARELASVITDNGGDVLTGNGVASLRVEQDSVTAAVLENRDAVEADIFVSNISPYALYGHMIPQTARTRIWRRRLNNLRPSVSSIAVYLGLAQGCTAVPRDGVFFWYATSDHDTMFRNILGSADRPLDHLLFFSAPQECSQRTLLLMTLADGSVCGNGWKERKQRMADAMVKKAGELFPGLAQEIQCMETASPQTFERYTGNTSGALLGFENTRDIYGEAKIPPRSYLNNLFHAGHWGKPGGGVWNVVHNGHLVSDIILNSRPEPSRTARVPARQLVQDP